MNTEPFQINNLITGCMLEPINELANNNPQKLYDNFDKLLSIYPVQPNIIHLYNNIITKIIESGYNLTTQNMNFIIKNHINNDIFKQKINFTNEIIEICCEFRNNYMLQHLFDNKIIPTSKMFTLLLKQFPTNRNLRECIDLFVYYGYVINYDNFILLTKRHIEVDWCEIPNNFITDEFNQLCDTLNFHPKYYVYTINFLHKKSSNLNNIDQVNAFKKFLNPNLQPDMICLINACKSSGKKALQFFVEECNLIPNNECLLAVLLNDKQQRKYIIEKYVEHHPNQ